jgi:hypothetical protein
MPACGRRESAAGQDGLSPPVNRAVMLRTVAAPDRRTSLKETAFMALALGAVLIVFFAPFLFGPYTLLNSSRDTPSLYDLGAAAAPDYTPKFQKTLDPSSGQQNEPWFALEHNIIARFHEVPFWNPYQAFGTPLAAAMQPQPFHPLSWIVEARPTPRSYDIFLVVRLFFAGLFAALYIRLFCGIEAALIAGVAAEFGGYFLLFYAMPHLSVETLLPALLWSLERLLRSPSLRRSAVVAIVVGLIVLGGMPESAALVLTCGAGYFLLRLLASAEKRKAVTLACASVVLGIAAGSIVLLPFVEYVANSFNTHQPQFLGGSFVGLQGDTVSRFARYMITELAPLAFGPPWNSITQEGGFAGVRGFSGMVVFFAAIVGLIALFYRAGRQYAQPTLYFAAVVVFLELKRFSNPLVNWVGYLPVYRLIVFPKYEEAIVTTCMALLCGFGFAAVFERRITRSAVIGCACAAVAVLSFLYYSSVGLVPLDLPGAPIYYGAVSIAIASIVVAVVGVFLWFSPERSRQKSGLAVIAFALVLECTTNYYVPLFIVLNRPTPANLNPYAGAPYISFLKKDIGNSATRVVGHPVELFPNWASAYGLDDPRTIDAILTQNFYAWMAAFNPGNAVSAGDHWTSVNVPNFNDPAFMRWLTLSSIGYVIVPNYAALATHASPFLQRLWNANSAGIPKEAVGHVSIGPYEVDRRVENALYEEPNITLETQTTVAAAKPIFAVDLALDPRAYAGPPCGEPLHFRLTVRDAAKRRVLAAAAYIVDPLRRINERRWITESVDLRRFAGQTVALRFETLAVNGNICKAWPLWGEPRFVSSRSERFATLDERYRLVYSADVNIFRFTDALPRVSIFHQTAGADDEDRALTALHDGTVDIRNVALVEGSVPASPATGPESARIDRRTSATVDASVSLTAPALLMLNDTYYPGWTATVDGSPTPINRTDFLFRGIAVPVGRHHIVFAYRSRTVQAGTAITIAAILAILAAAFYRPRKRRITIAQARPADAPFPDVEPVR